MKTTKDFLKQPEAGFKTVKPANRQTKKGQAMAELAVFGSFFLLIFGVLLSYGLKYNYQQRAQMTAFRRALKIASDQDRGSGSAMVVEDRSIPDPMQMFGAGSTQTVTASASVQRDYQMHAQVVDADALQGTALDMQTKRDGTTGEQEWMRRVYKTAGFRIENNVPTGTIKKYEIVYGSIRARSGGSWVSTSDPDAEKSCTTSHEETDPDTGITTTVCDAEAFAAIRIIDSCSGEVVDFDSCYGQARMLVDPDYCAKKCTLAQIPGSTTDCPGECAKTTNPPHQTNKTFDRAQGGAWYAADWTKQPAGCAFPNCTYEFPYLSELFGFGGGTTSKAMLLQTDYITNTERQEALAKTETNAAITTEQSASWSDVLNKTLVHQENIDGGGYEIQHDTPEQFINVAVDAVPSEVSGSSSGTWETNK